MLVLKGGLIIQGNELVNKDIYIEDGYIIDPKPITADDKVIDCTNLLITPGIVDLHVHLREPGYERKETIESGTMSAAKGGVTYVFAMPNVKPCPHNVDNIKLINNLIDKKANVGVSQLASITKDEKGLELADIKELSPYVLGYSDDGRGINDYKLLEEACKLVKEENKVILSHAEDYNYKSDDNRNESEAVRKEIEVIKKTGVKYHFCHMSTTDSFKYIKEAKASGLNITCEVTPHHLFLSNKDIKDGNSKMNPPLRSEEDRLATIKALLEGVADVIATDHAPHTKEEKECGYDKALNGIIGLETLVPLVYTNLIKTGLANYLQFSDWLINNPRKIVGLPEAKLESGYLADIAVFDINNKHKYEDSEILSKGHNSPFIGYELYGFCKYTIYHGKLIYGGE